MTDVKMNLTVHARGEMATKLLQAADHLGLPRSVIRSQTSGFLVPEEVHRYLFPSSYENDGETPVSTTQSDAFTERDGDGSDQYADMEFAELREAAKARDLSAGGSADDIRARLREADASQDDDSNPDNDPDQDDDPAADFDPDNEK